MVHVPKYLVKRYVVPDGCRLVSFDPNNLDTLLCEPKDVERSARGRHLRTAVTDALKTLGQKGNKLFFNHDSWVFVDQLAAVVKATIPELVGLVWSDANALFEIANLVRDSDGRMRHHLFRYIGPVSQDSRRYLKVHERIADPRHDQGDDHARPAQGPGGIDHRDEQYDNEGAPGYGP